MSSDPGSVARALTPRALLDVATVLAAFGLSWAAYRAVVAGDLLAGGAPPLAPYLGVGALFAVTCVTVFWFLGLYRPRPTVLNVGELETVLRGILLSAFLFFAYFFLLKIEGYSRLAVGGGVALTALLLPAQRRLIATALRASQLRGGSGRPTLIYGSGRTGRLLMKKISQAPHLGRAVVGFLDDDARIGSLVCCRTDQTTGERACVPVLGRLEDLEEVARDRGVRELLVVESGLEGRPAAEVLESAEALGLEVGIVPALARSRRRHFRLEELSALPVLRPHRGEPGRAYTLGKRALDLLGAGFLLVATAPLWAAALLAIRLESGPPALFVQERVGKGGLRFRLFKFRTMWPDTNPYAPSPEGDRDPRVTPVGRILRTAGFDELPQLLNVLRGEMSLVGPRPEMPFVVDGYSAVERERLRAKPGITGLWQLSPDRRGQIHDNLEYDLFYVRHPSLLRDVVILLETLFFTVGSAARRFLPVEAEEMAGLHGLARLVAGRGASALPSPTRPSPSGAKPRSRDGPVLVALDQRLRNGEPPSWSACMPAVARLAYRWPVRVLAVGGMRERIEPMLEATPSVNSGPRLRVEPAWGRDAIRSRAARSRAVVTDVPQVAEWVRAGGRDAVVVNGAGIAARGASPEAARIAEELSRWLPGPRQLELLDGARRRMDTVREPVQEVNDA